jgi:8-oxo-dGTP pyrophosphatase MutT (NUDIX family)
MRESAVLVALFDGDRGAEVVLTRRSWQLRHHKGEVSFPGGRTDPGETPVDTALREAWEEILLDPGAVTIVGELDRINTVVSRSLIVPVVGCLDGEPDVHPATMEVDRVFSVPLAELADPDVYHAERWGGPPFARELHFFELDGETVWGATARILVQLLLVVLGSG